MPYIRVTLLSPEPERVNTRLEALSKKAKELDIDFYGPYNLHQESFGEETHWRKAIGFDVDDEERIKKVLDQRVPDDIHRYIESPRTSTETELKQLESTVPEFPLRDSQEHPSAEEPAQTSRESEEHGKTSSIHTTDDELRELRKKAKQAGTEDVPQSTATTTQSVQVYRRSREIREYVKQRANGVCEGCGDPAPFTSSTGEPYLHTHHIYEISDGGTDTIDTVVALCPNCHYRVHHGQDGDSYNEELLRTVQDRES